VREGVAFVGAKLVARVYPAGYEGRVAVTIRRKGESVANAAARVHDGRLAVTVPTPGIGRFNVLLELRAGAGLAPRRLVVQVRARTPRDLEPGARGAEVIGLARRLGVLGFHLPGTRSVLGTALRDVVVAFQKAGGLRPTGAVTERDWRALGRARPLEARYRSPALHFEVDVRRQILLVVRGGRVTGVLSVAADGTETPAKGAFLVRTRSPLGTTWPGSVEVPRWAARWLHRQARAGARVYVYS
jgi:peptidoglycan hydrolase-like protein with peptidoglycan-binding domain